MSRNVLAFRFDARNHDYINIDSGETFPHITGMLQQTGWIDDTWFTEESSDRGTAVHRLTADYDLNALDVASCVSPFRAYLLSHVKVVSIMQPDWIAVEEPLVHPHFRFGGRPDRDCFVRHARATWEVKSGEPERSHQIQTALQAILLSTEAQLPPQSIVRYCCYVKPKGMAKLVEHINKRDFDEAYRVIRECTGRR
jgi:hypothetical protein